MRDLRRQVKTLRRSVAGGAVAAVLVVAMSAPAWSWPAARRVANWAPEFMASDHRYTRSEALAFAREYDVIVAIKGAFRDHVGAMRAANPRLRILAYQNGGYSLPGSSYPESWYAHTASGARIQSRDYGNYLMQIGNPNWREESLRTCRLHLRYSRYDGCFLDSIGPAALSTDYVTGLPIDPSTGEVWRIGAYVKAGRALAARVSHGVGRSPVVVNGIASGRLYFASPGSTGILADPVEGGMVELFVRQPFDPLSSFRAISDWRLDVDMLVHAGRNGRTLFCVTKAWSDAPQASKERLFGYALGTFLLGTNGRSYFSFLADKHIYRSTSAWDVGLGRPSRPYEKRDGVFHRVFRHGRVLVNPGDRGVRVRLPRRYETSSGDVVRHVWLADHTSIILLEP